LEQLPNGCCFALEKWSIQWLNISEEINTGELVNAEKQHCHFSD
jgi:hypothetical protein